MKVINIDGERHLIYLQQNVKNKKLRIIHKCFILYVESNHINYTIILLFKDKLGEMFPEINPYIGNFQFFRGNALETVMQTKRFIRETLKNNNLDVSVSKF